MKLKYNQETGKWLLFGKLNNKVMAFKGSKPLDVIVKYLTYRNIGQERYLENHTLGNNRLWEKIGGK